MQAGFQAEVNAACSQAMVSCCESRRWLKPFNQDFLSRAFFIVQVSVKGFEGDVKGIGAGRQVIAVLPELLIQ
jgi:hypothetical protein